MTKQRNRGVTDRPVRRDPRDLPGAAARHCQPLLDDRDDGALPRRRPPRSPFGERCRHSSTISLVPEHRLTPSPARLARTSGGWIAAVTIASLTGLGLPGLATATSSVASGSVSASSGLRVGEVAFGATEQFRHTADSSLLSAAVVDVDTVLGYQNGRAAGTGVVLSPDGEVVTNNHVVEGATAVSVTDVGNGRVYPADVTGYDRTHDVAVLHLRGASGLATAPIGNSSSVAVGDPVTGFGNAGGAGGAPQPAPGFVTALGRTITAQDSATGSSEQLTGLIETNANIQPGDSGGPLADRAGQVVGIDTAASSTFQLLPPGPRGYAIPINQALAVVTDITSATGSPSVHLGPTAFLGVGVADATDATGASPAGAAVRQVLPDTPAQRVGLITGDVIVSVDGERTDSATALTHSLDRHHPGDEILLGWVDPSGLQHTANVLLAAGPVG